MNIWGGNLDFQSCTISSNTANQVCLSHYLPNVEAPRPRWNALYSYLRRPLGYFWMRETRARVCLLCLQGGGMYVTGSSTQVTVTGSQIHGNTAGRGAFLQGGGLYILGGTVHIHSSEINQNTAGWQGGGVYIFSGTVTIDLVTFSGNTASSVSSPFLPYPTPP